MKDVKKDILWRAYLVYICMLVFAIMVIAKVVHIQFVEGDEWRKRSLMQTLDTMKVEAVRGNICASDGSLLATSVPLFDIYWDSQVPTQEVFDKNVDSLAYCLATLFKDKTKSQYKQLLVTSRKDSSEYCLIRKSFLNDEASQITYEDLRKVKQFPIFRLGQARGGIIFEQKEKRVTPYQNLAHRTIGFERKETHVYVGLEGYYTKDLEGIGGIRLRQKIAGGVWKPINDDNEIEPQNGSDIITTIDIDIQDVAEHALMKALDTNDADHGCVVLMEVATGHVKAISNLTRSGNGNYKEAYNYAIGERSDPGSTFKLMSVVAGIDDGLIKLSDMVPIGKYKYFDREMKDSHINGYGPVTVRKAFEQSSNVGISQAVYKAYKNNPQRFIDKLYSMQLNKPLGLDIGGEAIPYVKNTKDKTWSRVSLPWIAHGYEVELTPLQILTFYNAIANNGKMVKPMFVSEIRKLGKTIKTFNTKVIKDSICSLATAKKAQDLLVGVVDSGTAKNIKNSVYKIAGKTGTAQVAKNNKGYGDEGNISYKASFVGYFPADHPMYSCIVVINEPRKGKYYGGAISAPVFKEIADRVYARELSIPQQKELTAVSNKIPFVKAGNQKDFYIIYQALDFKALSQNPNSEWVFSETDEKTITMKEKSSKYGVVPDVVGMGIRDAVYMLESAGLTVKISGKGKVVKQSLSPGGKTTKGTLIYLTLAKSAAETIAIVAQDEEKDSSIVKADTTAKKSEIIKKKKTTSKKTDTKKKTQKKDSDNAKKTAKDKVKPNSEAVQNKKKTNQ
jgi:cell division protein FtsI (penicillin-binding protein 3)